MRITKTCPCLLVLTLAAAVLTPSTGAQELPIAVETRAARIERRVTERLEAWHVAGRFPGASAALVVDGRTIACTAGTTPGPDPKPIEPGDLFLSGSIGKTYLAAAFVSDTDIDLDDRLAEHLGQEDWYSRLPNADSVTLRQLARHQAGLPRHVFSTEFQAALVADRDRVWKPAELVAYVLDSEPLFAAGEGWAYADTNFVLLGMVLERVSGDAWYDYARERLLVPRGLEHTFASDQRRIPGLVQATVVMGRSFGFGPLALEDGAYAINPQFEWCGGGFASTAGDLAEWAHALYAGDALTPQQRAVMLDAVPAAGLGPGRSYGIGVILTDTKLGPLHGHDGFMPGYLSTMGYFPEQGIAGALMLNGDDARSLAAPPHSLLVELAAIAAEEK